MTTKEQAKQTLAEVIGRYEELPEKRRKALNEAEVCKDYILPMFAALGWNTASEEVAAEVRVGKTYADYAFKVDHVTRFFLEAKAPHVNLEDMKFAQQAVSYAWSKGIPWAVLTDFEGLKLFNAEWSVKDVNHLRVVDLPYTKYLEHFDEDLWPLNRTSAKEDGIRKAFEHRGGAVKKAEPVGEQLFDLFKQWRIKLLDMLQRYNGGQGYLLGQLDEAVQRVLDRLIFIRTLEDRHIEDPILLEILRRRENPRKATGDNAWTSLQQTFRWLDEHYDSNLFKRHLTDQLNGEESIVLPILQQLYSPNGAAFRFNFSAIEADVLGRVYEQYLGHVAQTAKAKIKRGQQLVIVELELATRDTIELVSKQAKRKQQGIYYTPKYIVDYIVEQTLGRLLVERGGDEKWLKTLTVLDPACGSGSFLIAAYDRLLRHYAEVRQLDGPEQLEQAERVDILTRHIYGVDLDPQAVEIARLNLVLRAVRSRQLLPDLSNNIARGNSLISGDTETLEGYFGPEWRDKHPLNWEERFPEIVARGGFDVVIGNPPYLFITHLNEEEKDYYSATYKTYDYRFDVYGLFIEQTVKKLLCDNGYISFIIPHTLLSNNSFEKLRRLLLTDTHVTSVIDIGPGVFQNASNETMVFVARHVPLNLHQSYHSHVVVTTANDFPTAIQEFEIEQDSWAGNKGATWLVRVSPSSMGFLQRLDSTGVILGSICTINQGLRTGDNEKYLSVKPASGPWKPAVGGRNVGRYMPLRKDQFVYYHPPILDAPRSPEIFESHEKIVVQEVRNIALPRRIVATYDDQQFYCLQSTNVINLKPESMGKWKTKFILGLLNSNLINFYFRQNFPGNNHIASYQLAQIPIARCTHNQQQSIVALVDELLEQHVQLSSLPDTEELRDIERQIAETERALDQLVYQLYGLAEEEIASVEGR